MAFSSESRIQISGELLHVLPMRIEGYEYALPQRPLGLFKYYGSV
jgi:hypothetical protein